MRQARQLWGVVIMLAFVVGVYGVWWFFIR